MLTNSDIPFCLLDMDAENKTRDVKSQWQNINVWVSLNTCVPILCLLDFKHQIQHPIQILIISITLRKLAHAINSDFLNCKN